MKNKKIIIILIISLVILAVVMYFVFSKSGVRNSNNSVSSVVNNDIENIDWSIYDSEEIILTKSVEITKEGVYKLTGTISDGYIYINTDGNVKLVLNNISITNQMMGGGMRNGENRDGNMPNNGSRMH